jgi:peptide/nickel transport system permease protein
VARRLIVRLGLGLIAVLGVIVVTFFLEYVVPGDPARALAPRARDRATIEQIQKELHLDDPLVVQFGAFVDRLAHGDLGTSYIRGESVSSLLWSRLPTTAILAFAGVVVEVLLGTVLGTLAAMNRRVSAFVTSFNLVFLAIPAFTLGLGLLLIFGFWMGLVPVTGGFGPRELILPALSLGLMGAPWYAQIVRDQMSDSLSSAYTRTAVAKGVSDRRILLRHSARNVASPVLTMIGMDLGLYLSGVVVVETVFGWPGIGQLAVNSLQQLDRPVVMGTVIVGAVAVIAFNLVADLLRMVVDPRARTEEGA